MRTRLGCGDTRSRVSGVAHKVSDVTETMSATEARRAFLGAQGLAGRRAPRRVGVRQFREYLARQGVLQLDSVNVLVRAHYMPLFSRHGVYDREALDAYLWGSGECFEHWGHEASVMPRELLPALHHRMVSDSSWKAKVVGDLERERPGLLEAVREAIESDGPVTAATLDHLAPAGKRQGSWWDHGHVKTALEYLFISGGAAVAGRPGFRRLYDAPGRVWGQEAAEGALPADAAGQVLFEHALAAVGVGTPKDLADHFRLKPGSAAAHAASAVERGLARWVEVEGWEEPGLLAVSAEVPARATGAALLSPFDPVCWYRPRLKRMFGMEYRIEIYTPAAKRVYGYYCLPFLLGDQMMARVDLKADRKANVLRAQASWREDGVVRGARRRPADEVASALAGELRIMADWLGLDTVAVEPRGTLAPDLDHAVRALSS